MYALLLASLTSVFTNSEASKQAYDVKCNSCKEYMRCHRLPSDIRHRVMDYLESSYQGKWFEEDAILMELSESLKQDVIIYNCQRLVSNMPLFKDTDPNFITAMLDKLQFEMYQTNDVIIRNGALGNRMFFIDKGTVLVESANLMCQLRDGDFFGELCLITGGRRSASVKALTPCRLYSLSVTCYRTVLQLYPEVKNHIEEVAYRRLQTQDGPSSLKDRHSRLRLLPVVVFRTDPWLTVEATIGSAARYRQKPQAKPQAVQQP
ncbi:potassium/sodium hyperpolarization-activated cyclic nucleotide-gated channel 2-like [Polyodon spathula]|uniref:potassium/sodium hyperpolarization-activated cyclic nucleotide-gated channel 2-like n=1 Tax=Polyodon spathula TaxID=7913 RepID=UPI001B7F427B|nr:potassium/sodium hyperpolarization-activated cyclic nucleotide-gated channel 2-like [Polyodon spathula]